MSDSSNAPVFDRITVALTEAGIPFKHMHHDPVYTSAEAAAVRGTPMHSGAKALILKGKDGFHLAVLPADMELHGNRLRRHLKLRRLRFATREEVLELTGLTPGSIPPFGSLFGLHTICDEHLAENERINFNAGSHTDSLQLAYEDWVKYESPTIVSITRQDEATEDA